MATRQADSSPPWGEFDLIDRLFAPLAHGFAGAFDLRDDVATLPARAGHELVLKTDSTIESVHFLPGDPPDTVAQKALRRALSDLAAKGAEPEVYLLAIALPENTERIWLERFVEGLSADQARFGIALAGGETNRTPGALTITVTALGWVPEGRLVRRSGARPGDDVWVTGTIGDAAGGLCLLKNQAVLEDEAAREHLVRRFRVPEPRLKFGMAFAGIASAAIDVSDGLVADLGHVADVSEARIEIELDRLPLSPELRGLWGKDPGAALRAASAGDDYEIAFTAPVEAADEIAAVAGRTLTPATRIGRVVRGSVDAVLLDSTGRGISLQREGYTHF
jgi:thiamine-monophosphate kinase